MVIRTDSTDNDNKGFSLLELIITISISTIILGLLFATYSVLFKNSFEQNLKADQIKKTIHINQKIKALLGDSDLLSVAEDKLIFYCDSLDTLRFSNGMLFLNRETYVKGLSSFVFSQGQKNSQVIVFYQFTFINKTSGYGTVKMKSAKIY